MYGLGFNHYVRFANGEGFANINKEITLLDMQLLVLDKIISQEVTSSRSSIIKMQ